MMSLAELSLAVKEGSIITAIHFVMQWFITGWVLANDQLACLVSGYSILFYVLNICFSVSQQAPDLSLPDSWLVSFSRFASAVFEPIINLGAFHIFWSPLSSLILRIVQAYSMISWVLDLGLSMPRHMLNNGIVFFSQPHMMHRAHQLITTGAAVWFIIRHIMAYTHSRSTQTISNKASSTHKLFVDGSNEQQYVYWAVREIMTNCDTHWRKYFTWRCHLEEGAPPEQIKKLCKLLRQDLPSDYKAFLQFTNGLNNVLDGGKPHLTFLPADSPNFAAAVYQDPDGQTRRLYVTWLIESMFGRGTRDALTKQTGYSAGCGQRSINLIKIASRENEPGGVFLVCPQDVQYTAQDWLDVALDHEGRCGALIGEIYAHTTFHFGAGSKMKALKNWTDWLVLQVQYGPRQPQCHLYPSFTAFLQTLAEITRRSTDDLMMHGIDESHYANHCCWKWEWEWARKSGKEQGIAS
ncbi:hypothetical protein F4859DRAFT_500084 [Xylaria cf. heliscus]|nr:hypothetical protein F4859DRAFT_500084 [Xylaria cf. heliscus]